ncbi:MmgE/PrpD family protein [Aeromicrobium sp. CF3.5]|uniref:MmgE/PrpD family protein n=1 Tax=Aeromicrobium sp. CF3.5 TaxID=3373078 RepID=UPI003EE6E2CC
MTQALNRSSRSASGAVSRYADLDDDRRLQLSHLVVDALALAAAGSANADAQPVLDGLAAVAPGQVPVPWTAHHLAPPQAAAALSTLIHAWDFDDTHDEAVVHTATVVVPAVLAAAQTAEVSGERVLDGLATGVHLFSRLARLVGPRVGVIRTTGLGAIAAAAAAGVVWGLEDAELDSAMALCLGATMAPSSRQAVVDGSVAKRLQPGLAAAHGMTAASMARHGVAGPAGWLDGTFGILPGSDLTLHDLFAAPHEVDFVALKPYPACRYTHAALAAAEELRARHPDPTSLKAVTAHLPAGDAYALVARSWKDRGAPLVDAQFSLPWQLAALWITGRYDLATLRDDLGRADIAEMAARIVVHQDLPESTVMSGARVEIETVEGNLDAADAAMPGAGANRLTRSALDRKVVSCVELAGVSDPRVSSDRLWHFVDHLPDLAPADLAETLRSATSR